MNRARTVLKKLIHNPYIDLAVGAILLVSGLWETWETIGPDLLAGNFRLHHGTVFLGFITALRAVADIFAGLEFMDEAEYASETEK